MLAALIGRTLGEAGFGGYAAALAWIFPFVMLAEFGINTLILREAARSPETENHYLLTALRIYGVFGGALTLILIGIAPLLSQDAEVVMGIRISAPFLLITPCFGAFTAIFRARQKMLPIVWLNLGMLSAQIGLTVLVLAAGGTVITVLIVNTVTSAGQCLAAWLIWRRRATISQPVLPLLAPSWKTIFRLALPFALAALLAALQSRVSLILLESLTNTSQVGYFAAAARFSEAGRMIPNALFGALFPVLAAIALQPKRLNHTFRWVLFVLGAYGFSLALIVWAAAGLLLHLTYGALFVPATLTLQIMMWALVPGLLRSGLILYWYARQGENTVNVVTSFTLIVQIVLSFWFIPAAGAAGAAAVYFMVETIGFAMLLFPILTVKKQK